MEKTHCRAADSCGAAGEDDDAVLQRWEEGGFEGYVGHPSFKWLQI